MQSVNKSQLPRVPLFPTASDLSILLQEAGSDSREEIAGQLRDYLHKAVSAQDLPLLHALLQLIKESEDQGNTTEENNANASAIKQGLLSAQSPDDQQIGGVLSVAVFRGWTVGVKYMLEAGFSVVDCDSRGWNAMHWLAVSPCRLTPQGVEIARLLRSHMPLTTLLEHSQAGAKPADPLFLPADVQSRKAAKRPEFLDDPFNSRSLSEARTDLLHEGQINSALAEIDESFGCHALADLHAAQKRSEGLVDECMQAGRTFSFNPAYLLDATHRNLLLRRDAVPPVEQHHVDDICHLTDPEEQIAWSWSSCHPSQMIVFSTRDFTKLVMRQMDTLPFASPARYRAMPASVTYLWARFACYHVTEMHDQNIELAEEVLMTWCETLEEKIQSNFLEDLPSLLFWLHNALMLLYFLRKDERLQKLTQASTQHVLLDLIEMIRIYLIRETEKRMVKQMEANMLEFSSLPPETEKDFEGDWKLMSTLKNITRTSPTRKPAKLPSDAVGTESPLARGSRLLQSVMTASLSPEKKTRQRNQNGETEASVLSAPVSESHQETKSNVDEDIHLRGPAVLTRVLSSILTSFRAYQTPSYIVVQSISQIMFWLATELFNRFLRHRRYLARSLVPAISANIASLEKWVRDNSLPTSIVTVHFAPLTQLLVWVQCLSHVKTVEDLKILLKSLSVLSKEQLNKVVEDYRYEVSEPRLPEECILYLGQLPESSRSQGAGGNVFLDSSTNVDQNHSHTTALDRDRSDNVWTDLAHFHIEMHPTHDGLFFNSKSSLPYHLPDDADPEALLRDTECSSGGQMLENSRQHLPYVSESFLCMLDKAGTCPTTHERELARLLVAKSIALMDVID